MAQKFKDRVLAGSGYSNRKVESDYASKLMMKMGWKEGEGLGKNKSGQVECIQIKRREEFLGLGNEAQLGISWNVKIYTHIVKLYIKDLWWEKGYNSTLTNLKPISAKDSDNDQQEFQQKPRKNSKTMKKPFIVSEDEDATSSDESVIQVVKKRITKKKNQTHQR